MLTIYRRHTKNCGHKSEGRKYRRCRCPIWVDGFLNGAEMRESLGLKDWEKAQDKIRKWEAEGTAVTQPAVVSLELAFDSFLSDAEARGLRESTLKKYRGLFKQMKAFSSREGVLFIKQWDVEILRKFRHSWCDKGISALKKLERVRAFFRFSYESDWIAENPATKLKNPEVKQPPTLPFGRDEIKKILVACDKYTDCYGRTGRGNGEQIRALVLLLRYAGLRIGDATSCEVNRLNDGRLFLYTHKTGVPVSCKLPTFVVEALNSVPRNSETYWFWSGVGSVENNAETWRRKLRRLFDIAKINDGHPHRFRDTFAVELLLAGVPVQEVSVLLGHSSIRVTETHYSPWVRARQEQLDANLERAWASDPVALSETKGTLRVHGKLQVVK